MTKTLQKLSVEQANAIYYSGDVLLTAIPGSGKTRSLINKIIHEHDDLDNRLIIAITYTRRAADEVLDRIYEQLGKIPSTIWVGTIHKFCLDFIVRGYGSYSDKFSKKFEIISEPDQEKIKQFLYEKYKLARFAQVDFTLDLYGNPNEKRNVKLVQDYYETIFDQNYIDFNYILYESYRILSEYTFIANQLSILIKFILIDEYQDTQELQYQVLALLSHNKNINFFIVGDSNQAIYEGIGGVVKSRDELDLLFARNFKELHLTGCYRSNQEIIDLYTNFAVTNLVMKSLTKEFQNPTIKLIDNFNKKETFDEIIRIITDLIGQGYEEYEICVVAPQWYHLYEFSNEIKKRLPNLKLDAPNLVPLKKDDDGIINKISRLLLTNFDYYNLTRIRWLAQEIIKQFDEEHGFRIKITVNDLLNIISESKTNESVGTVFLRNSLNNIFSNLGLSSYFQTHIDEFIQGTIERIIHYQRQGLEDDRVYFEQSLRSKSGVVVSTIHGVKGEEYRAVIAFGLLEGYIPHWNDIINQPPIITRTRSKKLLFVLCSRAKEKLYLFAENDRETNKGDILVINKDLQKLKNILNH